MTYQYAERAPKKHNAKMYDPDRVAPKFRGKRTYWNRIMQQSVFTQEYEEYLGHFPDLLPRFLLKAPLNRDLREALGEYIIKRAKRPTDHGVLLTDHYAQRYKREIYVATGTPDPSYSEGAMYNRTHPDGRKVNSPEDRKARALSYYKD